MAPFNAGVLIGVTSGRENVWNSDRRLADIWSNNESQNEAITGFDRSAHPWATTGAEIAGGLALPMGSVRSAADLAKFGAGYGLVSGLGREGSIPERLTSGVVGAGEGLAATVLGGKALEYAAPKLAAGWRWVRGRNGEPVAVPERVAEGVDGAPLGHGADAAPGGAPGAPVGDLGEVPLPPDGFTIDEPAAMPMAGDPGASLTQEARRPDYLYGDQPRPMTQPATEAQLQAMASGIEPRDVLPIPSNEIGSVEEAAATQAGRYAPAKAPDERADLTRRTLRAWNGGTVPKVGPIDMVGWLRLQGGLRDQGNELSHMGLTNAARKMDFAGQEQRFGPLVDDVSGMTLDDAAHAAWEAGYFPDHAERPSVNDFLDALRDTHEGRNRRFLPEDHPEIDRFENERADRYRFEEQRFMEGPIWQDRSVPADDAQPFPPVEAYEEWPAGGPDFAGNVNLSKLDSPQDISRALSQVHNRVGGFDAATRGRVTQAETERLAGELGMTPERLLSRRNGQALNAEEALAARQMLAKSGNELVNAAKKIRALDEPGDELLADFQRKLMRHVAIQEQVAGATAEAGRSLAQFRMVADSRAVRGDVLRSMVEAGGGKGRIEDAANILLDAIEESPGKFNALAEKVIKPRFRDKLTELYINALLSGPQTHAVNIVSNTLTALAQIPEHATAAVIGKGPATYLTKRCGPRARLRSRRTGVRAAAGGQGRRPAVRAVSAHRRAFRSRLEGRGPGDEGYLGPQGRGRPGADAAALCRG